MSNIIDKIRLSGTDYTLSATTSGVSVVEVTQAEYDALPTSAKTDTSKMYVITDAEAGDLTNYYTKTETNTLLGGKADTATTYTKSEVDTALSGKQETLVSGTNIKTINNTSILGSGNIDIQGGGGGGKAVEAGRGISVASGDSAYTVSFNLPISAGTGINSLVIGDYNSADHYGDSKASGRSSIAGGSNCSATTNNSFAFGYRNKAGGSISNGNFAQGYDTTASGNRCHSEGLGTSSTADASHSEGRNTVASGNYSHSEGENVNATNQCEHSQGRYNVSNKANTTWGDSGNTLFSVGNGTADDARHNAFEIRQNGDIYLSSGGTDIKLQDHLGGGGGGGTVDQTFDRDSTNAIANSAVTRNTVGSYGSASTGGKTLLQAYDQKGHGVDKLSIGFSKINNTPIFKIYSNLFELTNFSLVETSAITTSISSSSTDAQVPSAKAVYDIVGNIETLLSQI